MSNIDYKSKYIKYKKKYLKTLSEMEAGKQPIRLPRSIVKHPFDNPEDFTEKKYKHLLKIKKIMEELSYNNEKSIDEWDKSWEPIPEEVKKVMRTKPFSSKEEGKRLAIEHYDEFVNKAGNILIKARAWLDKTPEQRKKEKEEAEKQAELAKIEQEKEQKKREEKEKKREEKRRKKAEEREIEAEKQLQEYRARKKAERKAAKKAAKA
mgnify:CR=1 FL=1|tara:strand:- start:3 stop:626 length:624 start_codon:yes stop_codon:yes gene_type:complete